MPDDVLAFARAVLARTPAESLASVCPSCGSKPQTTRDGMCDGCTLEHRSHRDRFRGITADTPTRAAA